MQALRKEEDAYLEVSGAKGRCRTVFSRRRALESTGTCTMLSRRRSHFIASANRRARPLLRREERSRTTLAFSARTHQGQYLSSRLPFDRTERFLWREEPRFGKHRHRHNAQCVKKPRLRFHQPESAAAVET
ncbi:unnamed protein product [Coccothraustes coccothraustes]